MPGRIGARERWESRTRSTEAIPLFGLVLGTVVLAVPPRQTVLLLVRWVGLVVVLGKARLERPECPLQPTQGGEGDSGPHQQRALAVGERPEDRRPHDQHDPENLECPRGQLLRRRLSAATSRLGHVRAWVSRFSIGGRSRCPSTASHPSRDPSEYPYPRLPVLRP